MPDDGEHAEAVAPGRKGLQRRTCRICQRNSRSSRKSSRTHPACGRLRNRVRRRVIAFLEAVETRHFGPDADLGFRGRPEFPACRRYGREPAEPEGRTRKFSRNKHSGRQSVLLCPGSWLARLEFGVEMIGGDALRRLVTPARPEFKVGQAVQVDLPDSGHLQKIVGGGPQNLKSLDVARIVMIALSEVFSFRCWFPRRRRTPKPDGEAGGSPENLRGNGQPGHWCGPPVDATARPA